AQATGQYHDSSLQSPREVEKAHLLDLPRGEGWHAARQHVPRRFWRAALCRFRKPDLSRRRDLRRGAKLPARYGSLRHRGLLPQGMDSEAAGAEYPAAPAWRLIAVAIGSGWQRWNDSARVSFLPVVRSARSH